MEYDANNKEQSFEIVKTWHDLMENKRIQVRKVLQRIPKKELTSEQLGHPTVASDVEKFGYYDYAIYLWPEQTLDVLDFL